MHVSVNSKMFKTVDKERERARFVGPTARKQGGKKAHALRFRNRALRGTTARTVHSAWAPPVGPGWVARTGEPARSRRLLSDRRLPLAPTSSSPRPPSGRSCRAEHAAAAARVLVGLPPTRTARACGLSRAVVVGPRFRCRGAWPPRGS